MRNKGIGSLNAAIKHRNQISKLFVNPDPGLLNDPYDLMLNLVRSYGLDLGAGIHSLLRYRMGKQKSARL